MRWERIITGRADAAGREPRLSYPSDTLSGCNGDGVTAATCDRGQRRVTTATSAPGWFGVSVVEAVRCE